MIQVHLGDHQEIFHDIFLIHFYLNLYEIFLAHLEIFDLEFYYFSQQN